ncbi:hypothetical protein F5Y08DRAFT_152208 [Xylaria arbuscula]|nr:hypothetical protein F5Y08DRAFT_152208 [Xylaria arbuscula]
MHWAVLLATCHLVVAIQSDLDAPMVDDSLLTVSTIDPIIASTFTVSGTVYVMADQPTVSPSDAEPLAEKRDYPVHGMADNVEATVVIATVPPALSTILSPQDATAIMTAVEDATAVSSPGPSGTYGSGSNTGTSPGNGPGSGPGSGTGNGPGNIPGSGPGSSPGTGAGSGPGSDTGNNPTGSNPGSGTGSGPGSGPGSGGQPQLPSGAYGQPPPFPAGLSQSPNPAGQQTQNPTAQQSPSPGGQQAPNSQGQQPSGFPGGQSQNPFGGQSPNPTAEQSFNPAGQQSPNPTGNSPSAFITTVPILGTVVETVTISLQSVPGADNGPTTITQTQTLPTTFITIQASSPISTPCESNNSPWGPLSAHGPSALPTTIVTVPGAGAGGPAPVPVPPNTPGLPATFFTVPGAGPGGPAPISVPQSTPGVVTVTVPGAGAGAGGPAPNSNSPSTPSIVTVTVPGTQGPSSPSGALGNTPTANVPGPAATPIIPPGWMTIPGSPSPATTINGPGSVATPNGPNWATTPSVPSWATIPRTTVTVPNSAHPGLSTTIPQLSSSTCTTTGIYTNLISTSDAQGTTTAAATMAVGSSASSQQSSWAFGTSSTATPTVALVTGTNAATVTADMNLPIVYSTVLITLLASIARLI